MQDKVIVKEGKEISDAVASIMAKLDIIPFEVGVEPVAAFDGETKQIYVDIKIDKEAMIEALENDFGRGLAFAVEMGIMNDSSVDLIIGRAGIEGNAIDGLISEDKKEVVEEKPATEEKVEDDDEEKKEEDNTEEVKTSEEKE